MKCTLPSKSCLLHCARLGASNYTYKMTHDDDPNCNNSFNDLRHENIPNVRINLILITCLRHETGRNACFNFQCKAKNSASTPANETFTVTEKASTKPIQVKLFLPECNVGHCLHASTSHSSRSKFLSRLGFRFTAPPLSHPFSVHSRNAPAYN